MPSRCSTPSPRSIPGRSRLGIVLDAGAFPEPGHVRTVGNLEIIGVLACDRDQGSLILPALGLHMAVGKGEIGRFVVPAGGKIKPLMAIFMINGEKEVPLIN